MGFMIIQPIEKGSSISSLGYKDWAYAKFKNKESSLSKKLQRRPILYKRIKGLVKV